jgi:hypothetical protein
MVSAVVVCVVVMLLLLLLSCCVPWDFSFISQLFLFFGISFHFLVQIIVNIL